MKKLTLLLSLTLLISCDKLETDECECTKTTYERYVQNNHLNIRTVSTDNVQCQDEGSWDIDNTHYYTIKCK